ncbi:alpha/beta hydrolase [Mycolicibacillus parakoreensis]|uniref:Alpha/beta hydrolase n=1 Tax=Mycolicibacillus parakoreensis TaxID=1069221 RepID=A0ABY3TUL9_9MYCO|nr:alpha/beta hydrolase [Mycolicibacillus parakoreensis]MCV7317000.1 alpha/beta hydrolase [Mycolicibacillus parakoreensis]ULN51338.1 alpha/beta hydrolase [Mycolicibacillus parakoreensis]
MDSPHRLATIIGGLGAVLPRSVDALWRSPDWRVTSPRGARQFGEVLCDELTVAAMTLMAPAPTLSRPLSACTQAADELVALGVGRAHTPPRPLRVQALERKRFGRLAYERLSFDHDPQLPPTLQVDRLGDPARAAVHLCRHRGAPRPWVVWVHGAGQGNWSDLLVARVERLRRLGFNVALPVQPGHGLRRRGGPDYPGHDPLANTAGMMRAISEVRAVVRWLTPQATSITVAGISLGSPVAALVSHLEAAVDAVAVYTPIGGLNAMVGRHLWRWGAAGEAVGAALRSETAAALMSVVDPLATDPVPAPRRRLIVAARHDRMAYPDPAVALGERWGARIHWHDGGHVGQIFAPGVQAQTLRFLKEVSR